MATWTLWQAPPANPYPAADDLAVSLGTQFEVSSPVRVTALKWFRTWGSGSGQRLGALFRVSDRSLVVPWTELGLPDEAAWSETAVEPVELAPGVRYMVVVWHPNGRYPAEGGYFLQSGFTAGPLVVPSAIQAAPQGAYGYGTAQYPTETYNGGCYFSDLVAEDIIASPPDPEPEPEEPVDPDAKDIKATAGILQGSFQAETRGGTTWNATLGARWSSSLS